MAKAQFMIPLDIPDVQVLEISVEERGEILSTIESTEVGTARRKCGEWIAKLHGRDEIERYNSNMKQAAILQILKQKC